MSKINLEDKIASVRSEILALMIYVPYSKNMSVFSGPENSRILQPYCDGVYKPSYDDATFACKELARLGVFMPINERHSGFDPHSSLFRFGEDKKVFADAAAVALKFNYDHRIGLFDTFGRFWTKGDRGKREMKELAGIYRRLDCARRVIGNWGKYVPSGSLSDKRTERLLEALERNGYVRLVKRTNGVGTLNMDGVGFSDLSDFERSLAKFVLEHDDFFIEDDFFASIGINSIAGREEYKVKFRSLVRRGIYNRICVGKHSEVLVDNRTADKIDAINEYFLKRLKSVDDRCRSGEAIGRHMLLKEKFGHVVHRVMETYSSGNKKIGKHHISNMRETGFEPAQALSHMVTKISTGFL